MTIRRYVGIGKESVYRTKAAAAFHIDPAAVNIGSPEDPFLHYEGGLGRMQKRYALGPYMSAGSVDFAGSIGFMWYLFWMLLGEKVTTDNTTSVTGEAHPTGVGETELVFTTTNKPVTPGSFILEDSVPAQVAHDDGFGKIVEDGASGVSGSIDYATGTVRLQGLTGSEAYTIDYDYGTYEHIITPTESTTPLSFTVEAGKDYYEEDDLGQVMSKMSISVDREFFNVSIEVMGAENEVVTIKAEADLKLVQEPPIPFHQVQLKQADFGSALADMSCEVESFTLDIETGADTEAGLGLNSRFPCEAWAAILNITGAMTLKFRDDSWLQDFWGGTTPVGNTPQEKTLQLLLNAGDHGDGILDLHRVLLQSHAVNPSGRERVSQEIAFKSLYDAVTAAEILTATFNALYNWA